MKLLLDTHIVVWAALDPDALTPGERRQMPLTARHAVAVLAQTLRHKDPFDELLLVQAQEEGMRLLTRDTKLVEHPLAAGV